MPVAQSDEGPPTILWKPQKHEDNFFFFAESLENIIGTSIKNKNKKIDV
jgi:hypothetical protein